MRTIDEIIIKDKTLREHLELHKKWLNNEEGGIRLDLQYADLQYADLQYANLRDAELQYADLQYANLRVADLRGAELDFSCFPLWCGALNFKIDEKQAKQLMYHVINLMQYSNLDTKKIFKKATYKWLKDSHLVTKHNMSLLEEKDE